MPASTAWRAARLGLLHGDTFPLSTARRMNLPRRRRHNPMRASDFCPCKLFLPSCCPGQSCGSNGPAPSPASIRLFQSITKDGHQRERVTFGGCHLSEFRDARFRDLQRVITPVERPLDIQSQFDFGQRALDRYGGHRADLAGQLFEVVISGGDLPIQGAIPSRLRPAQCLSTTGAARYASASSN